jgi:hypothetical protein
MILHQYQAMCEGGWSPTIVFHTTVVWSNSLRRFLRQKTFCYRTNSSIPILFELSSPSVGTALAAEHRKTLIRELDNHDVFIYHEDDIIFKYSHLVAYLYETKRLHHLLPDNGLRDHVIGFQRYRRLWRGEQGHRSSYGEQDIFEQENMEETPNLSHMCIGDTPYLAVSGNTHQAMWIFTREQVNLLQEKCQFLNHSSPSRWVR